MTKIVVFGANGQAGRQIVAAAQARGHEVTAVGRDPGVFAAAEVAAGHDVAVSAVYDAAADPAEFYAGAARALVASGVPRIVVVGIYPLLETAPGVRIIDGPDFPEEHKPFCLGHAAGVDVLRESAADWLVMSPIGDFGPELTYEQFGVAVVDEIERPTRSRTQIGVAG